MRADQQLQVLAEHEIPDSSSKEIADLLEVCFPATFDGRTYYKQLPHFRLLWWRGGTLVAQLGIDSRVVNVDTRILKIFGVIDLCVHPEHRSSGMASQMLSRVEEIARLHDRDHLVLMADRHDVYLKCGFVRVEPAFVTWLAIDERKTVDVFHRDLSDCFLVKPLSSEAWPAGEIDMLGYLF